MITEYIHNKLVPELVKKEVTTKVESLKRCDLTELCDTTVLKWMHVLVFQYEIYMKNYYVDTHKIPGTNGKVIFEYHVDTIPEFRKIMADNFFGRNMSVTMGVVVRPLIEFSQYKLIFKKYIF